jgi:hypothetical protein
MADTFDLCAVPVLNNLADTCSLHVRPHAYALAGQQLFANY